MTLRKRFLKKNKRLQNQKTTTMKKYSGLIYLFIAATLLVSSLCLVSTALSSTDRNSSIVARSQEIPEASTVQSLISSPLTSASFEQPTVRTSPQFDVDLIYAYVGPRENHFTAMNPFQDKIPVTNLNAVSLYPSTVYLNFTHVSNAKNEVCDAEIEVYLIEIVSDNGLRENYTCFFGTNYNPSFSETSALNSVIKQIDELIDTNTTDRLTGLFNPDMATNQSLWFKVGSLESYTSCPSKLGMWSAGKPNVISINIRRIGWIALNGTVISTSYARSEDMVQVKLAKSGEGFLYDNIAPQNKLPQTDIFHPIDTLKPLT